MGELTGNPSWLLPGGLRHHALPPGLAQAVSKQEKGEAWGLPRSWDTRGKKLTLQGLLSLEGQPESLGPQPYLGLEGIKARGEVVSPLVPVISQPFSITLGKQASILSLEMGLTESLPHEVLRTDRRHI